MEKSIKYSVINSFNLSECFTDIKSVCVVGGAYNTVSICVRAKASRLCIIGYGESTREYKYFYISCSKFGTPVAGTVITPELYSSITIMEKKAEDIEDKEELTRFYKVKFSSKVKY